MEYVTKEDSVEDIDVILRKNRGKIIFKHKKSEINIDTGKYKSNYAARIFNFCQNEIVLNNSEKIYILLEKLKTQQYSEINCLLSELNAKGAYINLTPPIRISPKIKKCQIRMGSLPIFIIDDNNSELKTKCFFESPICKNDSKNFKPQFLLQSCKKTNLKDEIKNNSIKDLNFLNSEYIYCGKFNDGSIFDIISSNILFTIDKEKNNFDINEFLGLTKFCYNLGEIKKMVIYKEQEKVLESSYKQLLSSSLRSNEIHKNFGELYAAIKYSCIHPNDLIYIPDGGSFAFFDFISIEKANDKYIVVKKIPVKIKPRGAAVSFTALLSCLYFNKDHPLYKEIKVIIDNCPKNNSIIHQLKTNNNFDELISVVNNFYKHIEYQAEGNVYDFIKPIFKDVNIARKFWAYILPAVDIERTKAKIEIGLVGIDGTVDFIKFNPLTVSISSAKKPNENVTALITNKKEK